MEKELQKYTQNVLLEHRAEYLQYKETIQAQGQNQLNKLKKRILCTHIRMDIVSITPRQTTRPHDLWSIGEMPRGVLP